MNSNKTDTDLSTACKRAELRIGEEMVIFVETYSSPQGEARNSSVVISKTVDISANGVQVVMDKPVEVGSILQVCVEFRHEPYHYHLTGEVKWVAGAGQEQEYLVGFQLLESEQTDIEAWKHRIAAMVLDPGYRVY